MSIAAGLTNLGVLAIVVHPIPFFNERSPVRRAPRGVGYHNDPAEPGGGLGLRHLADSVDKRYVMALRLTLRPRWRRFSMPRFTWDGRPCTILHVFALGLGGSIPGRPAFQAEFFGFRAFGAIQGLAFTIATLGELAGPVFAGWPYDMTDSYRLAFVILSAGSLLAVPLVLSVYKPAASTTTAGSTGPHAAAQVCDAQLTAC